MNSPTLNRDRRLRHFERLGLRWNPFRIPRPEERSLAYLPDLYDATATAADIANSDASVTQIIADSGHGKSTLLAAVLEELDQADVKYKFHYLQPTLFARVAVPASEIRVLVVDEFERLTRWNRRRLVRWTQRGHRLIVSTHRDLRRSMNSPVATVRLSTITVDGLQRYFTMRVEWASGDIGQFELTDDAIHWLLQKTGGNLRVVDAVLYESFQTATPHERLVIDAERLRPFEAFARERAEFDAQGNLPPGPLRRLGWLRS